MHQDRFTAAVRRLLDGYASVAKVEAVRLELIHAGIFARDEGFTPPPVKNKINDDC